jgi:hypothetical protein
VARAGLQVFEAYCAKTRISRDMIRFLVFGERVDLRSVTGTAGSVADCMLEDGDVIDAMLEQRGD